MTDVHSDISADELSIETFRRTDSWLELIEAVIEGRGTTPHFQPIIELEFGGIVGFEALARFESGPPVAPNLWFAEAARRGVVAEFDAAVLHSQLSMRHLLPSDTFMSVNVEPESLLSELVLGVFSDHAPLDGLVVEVTEHRGLGDPARIRQGIDQLRRQGALIAVDDAGAGYAGLQQILILEPQILKLDRSLIAGIDGDETKASLVEMLGVFADRIDAQILAEGVETESEARTAASLGVKLAQGFYFARPALPWAAVDDSVVDTILDHSSDRLDIETLRPVLSVMPAVEGMGAALCTGTLKTAGSVVLTRNNRPVGLLPASGSEPIQTLVTNINTSPADLANRIATGPPERASVPVLVTDGNGRYLGVVTINRLLKHLAKP